MKIGKEGKLENLPKKKKKENDVKVDREEISGQADQRELRI